MSKIKLCGLNRPQDIAYANIVHPDYAGFIIDFPKSHRNVTSADLRALVAELDSGITPVGVFVDAPISTITGLCADNTLGMVQLHGHEDDAYIRTLREQIHQPIVQAFKVNNAKAIAQATLSIADYILLDSGAGSGQTFDWQLIQAVDRPFFLAGGLTPDNIAEAIAQTHPYAVDLSSGVEINQIKDLALMERAVAATRQTTKG